MAQDMTVDLGSFGISSYLDKNFVLAVSTSLLLSVPAQFCNISTAADLREQVQTGSLWITRAGSCHIELSIDFLGSFMDGSRDDLQRMCVEAFEISSVWDALGLNIRREFNQFNDLRGSRSLYPYSVQHNQQNSGLIAPDEVPCAYLSILSCDFTLGPRSALEDMLRSNTLVTPSDTKTGTWSTSSRNVQEIAAAKQHRTGPKKWSISLPQKSKIVTLKAPPTGLRRIFGVPEICSLSLDLQEKRLEHLTHTALHLVFGSRKRVSGIQFLKKSGAPTVLEVAPAVWSGRYFRDVVSRAQLTLLVSSALGNLMSTESPTLRDRFQSLGLDPPQEIHRRTLSLVLRSARVPKLQIQVQRTGSLSQIEADSVIEDDGIHYSNGPQDDNMEQELHEAMQNDPPQDGTLSSDETDADAHHVGTDLTHDDALPYESEFQGDEELVLDYEMPYSGCGFSAVHSLREDFEGSREFSDEQLLHGVALHDRALSGIQGNKELELQDDLIIDAMDEEDVEGSTEWPVGMAYRSFEHELPYNRYHSYHRHDSISDMELYDGDVDFNHYHQTHIDTEPERGHPLVYRCRFQECDDAEDLEDEVSDGAYWTEQSRGMGSGDCLPPDEEERAPFGCDENFVDVCCDTDGLEYAMDQSLEKLEKDYQYENMSTHPDYGFTDEHAASMATGQEVSDETESVLGEPHGYDAGEHNCGGAMGEGESSSEHSFMLCGEDMVRSLASPSYHVVVPERVFHGSHSQGTEISRSHL